MALASEPTERIGAPAGTLVHRVFVAATVLAGLALFAFVSLSFTQVHNPEGVGCGNFWGGIDLGGCHYDAMRARVMSAWWLFVGAAGVAITAGLGHVMTKRRRRE